MTEQLPAMPARGDSLDAWRAYLAEVEAVRHSTFKIDVAIEADAAIRYAQSVIEAKANEENGQ
jgi:hypothetical protein